MLDSPVIISVIHDVIKQFSPRKASGTVISDICRVLVFFFCTEHLFSLFNHSQNRYFFLIAQHDHFYKARESNLYSHIYPITVYSTKKKEVSTFSLPRIHSGESRFYLTDGCSQLRN